MSSKLETMTEAEAKLLLAEREKDCHHDKEGAWDEPGVAQRCSDCQGTGQVAMFPTLRRVCSGTCSNCYPGEYGWLCDDHREPYLHGDACGCQGRGWVVAEVHLEDLLALACEHFGVHHVAFDYENDKVWAILTPEGMDSDEAEMSPAWAGRGKGTTEKEAVLRALVAVKAQEEKS